MSLVLPGGTPFLQRGGPTGCLLIHGFTAMPDEMRKLGDHLADQGHTVLGVRLAGHGTRPEDLSRTRWRDWLVDVEDGLALLEGLAERIVLVGQSLGGMVVLTAASRYPVAGVVAISTPLPVPRRRWERWLELAVPRLVPKPVAADPELGSRKEAGYPAYAASPTRINRELEGLAVALRGALPAVEAPVLVVQSTADPWVPAADAQRIHELLRSGDRRLLLVEGLDHSIVLDPKRAEVFAAVGAFVDELSASSRPP